MKRIVGMEVYWKVTLVGNKDIYVGTERTVREYVKKGLAPWKYWNRRGDEVVEWQPILKIEKVIETRMEEVMEEIVEDYKID